MAVLFTTSNIRQPYVKRTSNDDGPFLGLLSALTDLDSARLTAERRIPSDAERPMAITIITETYNHLEGQSWHRFERSVSAAIAACEGFSDDPTEGPNHVLVIDASPDGRAEALIAAHQPETMVNLRHLRVPVGTSYDQIKDLGALEATTPIIVYLDGDCIPVGDPAAWLRAMFDELSSTGAPGVSGSTVYEGTSPLSIACSAMDFGFVHYRDDGVLTSYTSNNVMFLRAARVEDSAELDGMRCSCYPQAQRFLRNGAPLRHARSAAALVSHEMPPIWDERFRRGYDAVAVAWEDPRVFEARCFGGNHLIAASLGLARYLTSSLRLDARSVLSLRRYQKFGRARSAAAIALLPVLRIVDALGIWRALLLGPDPRWRHPVRTDQLTSRTSNDSALGL